MTKTERIKELLTRGVTNIIEEKHLDAALKSNRKLRVKFGIDPTGPKVHIGHAVTLWKLRQFQDLGHKIVLIIGDFTAQIGDPSDKEAERQSLTRSEIESNKKDYLSQIGKIFDLKKTEIHHNSDWHGKSSKQDLIEEAMNFTVNQMSQRDNFAQRLSEDKPVGLHEFLYPLLQGMDSVSVRADVELGGNDQYFNLLAGRTLQKKYGQKPQDIMTFDLLEGTDGRKMSKTYDNAVYLLDEPNDKYGKIMSIADNLILRYFEMATEISSKEVARYGKELNSKKTNPRDIKAILAYEIVRRYHGDKEAKKAKEAFEKRFVKKENPDEMPVIKLKKATMFLTDILVDTKLAPSKSEARRLVEQNGVRVDGTVICQREAVIEPHTGMIIQVGKRKFVKIK
jgi:tyrosyl-tRNA synthetase